jgi:FlaA1/EpsC-like NDP-sugar epimerase
MIFDVERFVAQYVTGRQQSLFASDMQQHHAALRQQIAGRSVLVIGGAGTIGSAFIKALLPFDPERIQVVDHNENGLTALVRTVRSGAGYRVPDQFLTCPIDYADPVFEKLLRREGPFDIVANFAAHKHVRSEKDSYAIEAMLDNNVFKTRRLLQLLAQQPPKHFFCVSTDKASHPVNVMGASKKLMERVVMAFADQFLVTSARFANVAFSNGSLPAGFLERLQQRQPISAPMDVGRYFLSEKEAGELCLLACILGRTGELFFPKLTEDADVRRFSDMATNLLQTLGYQPDICLTEQEAREKAARLHTGSTHWPVYFFNSDTTGEKMVETFYEASEHPDWSRFEQVGVLSALQESTFAHRTDLMVQLDALKTALSEPDVSKQHLIMLLQQLIPEFRHEETGKNLDQKM